MRVAGRLFKLLGILFFLQVVSGFLVYYAYDVRPLAIVLSLAYLAAVVAAGRLAGRELPLRSRATAFLLGLLVGCAWQAIGLTDTVVALRLHLGLSEYDGLNDLIDFIAQTWHTALVPLFSLAPNKQYGLYVYHFWAQVFASPVMAVLLASAMALRRRRR